MLIQGFETPFPRGQQQKHWHQTMVLILIDGLNRSNVVSLLTSRHYQMPRDRFQAGWFASIQYSNVCRRNQAQTRRNTHQTMNLSDYTLYFCW